MEIKLAIGSKEEKKVFKHIVSGADAEKLFGKKIGDKFRGEIIGLNGYELEITGGSDNSGFPMRKDIDGPGRKKVVVVKSLGFNSKIKGQRKRRSIRGNTISADTAQINCKVVKAGKDKIAKLLGGEEKPTEGEAPAEKPVEQKQEEKPAETPKEEPKQEEAPVEEPKAEEKKEEKPAESEEKPAEE
jgi:small subunit ribosomal protein S6e